MKRADRGERGGLRRLRRLRRCAAAEAALAVGGCWKATVWAGIDRARRSAVRPAAGDRARRRCATRTNRAIAAAFDATDRNASTSADAPSNTSGHQKWNGTAESLNARPTMIIRPARTSTISVPPLSPLATMAGNVHRGQLGGDRRQVGRAQQAGQQADAVEHDAGGAGAVDGVLQRRFAGSAAALEHAGQHVRRHARHLDAQEDRHQMIGRRHQAHAERRAQQQRVKVLAVLAVGEAGHPHEDDEPERERQQEHAEVGRSTSRRPACR